MARLGTAAAGQAELVRQNYEVLTRSADGLEANARAYAGAPNVRDPRVAAGITGLRRQAAELRNRVADLGPRAGTDVQRAQVLATVLRVETLLKKTGV